VRYRILQVIQDAYVENHIRLQPVHPEGSRLEVALEYAGV